MSAIPLVLGFIGDEVQLLIKQGASFGPHEFTLSNPDDSPVDLTGCSVHGQMRRKATDPDPPLHAFAFTVSGATAGRFVMDQLTPAQTAALPAGENAGSIESKGTWDCYLQDGAGAKTPICYGPTAVFRRVTRP